MKVFVYGAKGLVGQNVVNGLLEAGHEVIAGTRNPEKGESKKGLRWVFADAMDPKKGLDALSEVEALFLLSPPGHTNQFDILSPWIEKGKSVGLKKIVLMTAMGVEYAPPEAPFRKTELLLEDSGVSWNIIRPNWFMQNFHTFWIQGIMEADKIFFPGGNAVTSFIDARDISAVAVKLLTSDSFKNQAFALTGGEALTHTQVAEKISKQIGRTIGYVDVSPEDFKKGLLGAGLPADYSDFLVMIAGSLKEGNSSPILDSVKKITGKEPINFDSYVTTYVSSWKK